MPSDDDKQQNENTKQTRNEILEQRKTNFSNSDLSGVSLMSALAQGSNFSGANLTNADLESGNYEDADCELFVLERGRGSVRQTEKTNDGQRSVAFYLIPETNNDASLFTAQTLPPSPPNNPHEPTDSTKIH